MSIKERFVVSRQVQLDGQWVTATEYQSSSAAAKGLHRAGRTPVTLEDMYDEKEHPHDLMTPEAA